MSERARCRVCRELLDADGSCPVCAGAPRDLGGTAVVPRPDLGGSGPLPVGPLDPELSAMPLPRGLSVVVDVLDGPERGRTFSLRSSGAIIGREEGDVPLADPRVSRRHAALEVYGPAYVVLRDLASTNGTYVNGRLVAYCRLADGDEVRVGDTRLAVTVDRGERQR